MGTQTQIYNSLSAGARALADRVYAIFGRSNVTLTSGQRSASHNAGIPGASSTSQHIPGDAFDFKVKGMDPKTVQAYIAGSGIAYGQSIAEYGLGMNPRNHLSVATGTLRNQNLIAKDGKYSAIKVTQNKPRTAAPGREYLEQQYGPYIGGLIADSLQSLGGALQVPGQVLDGVPIIGDVKKGVEGLQSMSLEDWFRRGAILVFALIFIAAALFMFKGSDIINVAKGAIK